MEDIRQDESTKTEKKQAKVFTVISQIITVLLFLFVLFLLFVMVTSRGQNGMAVGPFRGLTILTGSMEPAISVGSLVITKQTDVQDIAAGDVITYEPVDDSQIFVTHRVISVLDDGRSFRTKGDANNIEDTNPVSEQEIIGRVILVIPVLGAVLQTLGTPQGFAFIIFLFVLFLVLEAVLKKIFSPPV